MVSIDKISAMISKIWTPVNFKHISEDFVLLSRIPFERSKKNIKSKFNENPFQNGFVWPMVNKRWNCIKYSKKKEKMESLNVLSFCKRIESYLLIFPFVTKWIDALLCFRLIKTIRVHLNKSGILELNRLHSKREYIWELFAWDLI